MCCAAFSHETALGIFAAHRIQASNPGTTVSRGMPSFKRPEQETRLSETAEAARTPASPPHPHNASIVWGIQPTTLSPPFCKPGYNNDWSQDQRAECLVTVSTITTCTSWINPNCSFSMEFVCVLSSNTQRLWGKKKKEISQKSLTEVMKQHK